jgi:hypothetical protein
MKPVLFDVWTATDEDYAQAPHLWLQAARIIDGAPVATGAEFRRFIAAWARNDPNGTWNSDGIAEGDGALVYEDECGRYVWPVAEMASGVPLYTITGMGDWYTSDGALALN